MLSAARQPLPQWVKTTIRMATPRNPSNAGNFSDAFICGTTLIVFHTVEKNPQEPDFCLWQGFRGQWSDQGRAGRHPCPGRAYAGFNSLSHAAAQQPFSLSFASGIRVRLSEIAKSKIPRQPPLVVPSEVDGRLG